MNTEDFNRLFTEITAKDTGEIAKEQRDYRTAGRTELIDRERLRRVVLVLCPGTTRFGQASAPETSPDRRSLSCHNCKAASCSSFGGL